MATPAQIIANRANAQLCTGPRTAEGKEHSSQNALRHGLTSARLILPSENPAEFDALLDGLTRSWNPTNLQQEILVRELAENYWKHRRARRVQNEYLAARGDSPRAVAEFLASPESAAFERLLRYAERIERAYYRSLRALERLHEARRREDERQKREAAIHAKQAASEARRQNAEAKRKSEELLQQLLSPSPLTAESVSFCTSPLALRTANLSDGEPQLAREATGCPGDAGRLQ